MYIIHYIRKYFKQIEPPSARDFVQKSNILMNLWWKQIYSWKATWVLHAF